MMKPVLRNHVSWASALLLLVLACTQQQGGETSWGDIAATAPTAESATTVGREPTPEASPVPDPTPTPESGGTSEPSAPAASAGSAPSRTEPYTPTGPPPKVDRATASVPLDEVVFDTFAGGYIPMSQATDREVERLRDAIKPIYEPVYDPVEGGDWLDDRDLVIGYATDSGAYAYPLKIMNFHEIVNDLIDDVPVLVSYCPLCASGVVYDRRLGDEVLLFGNTSALHESDMVMYDHQTGSYWFQVVGEAIVGSLTGMRLTLLPSMTITWGEWKRLHSDTLVLSPNLGLLNGGRNPYLSDPFARYASRLNRSGPPLPISPIKDARLLPGDKVFAVQLGDSHRAYELRQGSSWLVNDAVGGTDVLVVGRGKVEGPSATAFFRELDGRSLRFKLNQDVVEDEETGISWNDSGLAVSGPLAGKQLAAVPSRTSLILS